MRISSVKLEFATWLRVFSTLFILICHYCAACAIPIISMLSQVFNVGVQLFFILSGFLAGYKGITCPYVTWYIKRAIRIFIPYWIFLLALSGLHIKSGMDVFNPNWFLLIWGMQGSNVGVWGAGHTWFISVLLLCYILTPVILCGITKLQKMKNQRIGTISCLLVCASPCVYALAEPAWVYTIFTPVSLYILACVLGVRYRNGRCRILAKSNMLLVIAIMVISFGLRFVSRIFIDGSIAYDRIVVPYTHMIAAFAIVVIVEKLFSDIEVPKAVQFVSDISFEIYLWHYMFVVGPVSIFEQISNWGMACIETTIVVVAISLVSNKIAKFLTNEIFSKAYTRRKQDDS